MTPTRSSFRSRACENCRVRKIRCDRESPCSGCRGLGIICSLTADSRPAVRRSQPPTTPSDTSAPSISRADDILERLSALEKSVHELLHGSRTVSSSTKQAPCIPAQVSSSAGPTFEGQSSFNSETRLARDAAYSAIATLSGTKNVNQSVSTALLSLKNSLDSPRQSTSASQDPNLSDVNLLPVSFVVALVKRIKTKPPFYFVYHSLQEHVHIESLCQKIYFPSKPIPGGSTTLLYGLLYYAIRDYMHEEDPELSVYDCAAYAELCERQLNLDLKNPDLGLSPTLEKVQAMLIAVIKAQEESNLQLCWSYLSTAFNMCQLMGYHRNSALKNDPPQLSEAKRHVFWRLYMIDKNLSLNLGLTSHFQDHDIDVDPFTPSRNPQLRPWDLMGLVIIKFSTIQGQVYDKLYSATASRVSPEKKAIHIEKLSADLIAVRDELLAIDVSSCLYSDSLHGMTACADFIAYSVLTVIYRAQTLPENAMTITTKCLETARLALRSHLKAFSHFSNRRAHKQAEYANWILLYPSFTPFVIVFTNTITTSNTSDLSLLQNTVLSLEPIRSLSQGSSRLYEICKAFLNTAQVLIDSRQTLTGLEQIDDGSLIMPLNSSSPSSSAVAVPVAETQTDGTAARANLVALPEVTWPEDMMQEVSMSSADISGFLNEFLGASRPVGDMWSLNYMDSNLNE
ncbi:hypothetical protein VTO42DRAFT_6138 [Malbranchea cinnamomea]